MGLVKNFKPSRPKQRSKPRSSSPSPSQANPATIIPTKTHSRISCRQSSFVNPTCILLSSLALFIHQHKFVKKKMNNINGHGGRRSAMASMDFYRRVPKDLTEVSTHTLYQSSALRHLYIQKWNIHASER